MDFYLELFHSLDTVEQFSSLFFFCTILWYAWLFVVACVKASEPFVYIPLTYVKSGVQWPVTLCPLIKNNPPHIIHNTWQISVFFSKSLPLCNVSSLQCTQWDAIDSVRSGVQRLFFLCNAVWKCIFLYTSGHEFYDVVLVCVRVYVCVFCTCILIDGFLEKAKTEKTTKKQQMIKKCWQGRKCHNFTY